MKVTFDDLTVQETNVLTQCLIAFRSGQPFAWAPTPGEAMATLERMGFRQPTTDNGTEKQPRA